MKRNRRLRSALVQEQRTNRCQITNRDQPSFFRTMVLISIECRGFLIIEQNRNLVNSWLHPVFPRPSSQSQQRLTKARYGGA